jgi:hypothetical protein
VRQRGTFTSSSPSSTLIRITTKRVAFLGFDPICCCCSCLVIVLARYVNYRASRRNRWKGLYRSNIVIKVKHLGVLQRVKLTYCTLHEKTTQPITERRPTKETITLSVCRYKLRPLVDATGFFHAKKKLFDI